MTETQVESPLTLTAPTSAEAVLANTEALLPLVAAAGEECDTEARLTPNAVEAFRRAGVFEMAFPRRVGGLEMTLADQVNVVARIARADGGIAWNVGVLNATGYYAGRLGAEAYEELYPTRDMPTSGSFHPKGRADVVDGGYLVTGSWDWGSGSYIAEHIIGGCLVFDGDEPVIGPNGKQLILGLWLPRTAIRHADNWQVLGVRASGSSSYSITEPTFIPTYHAFDREPLPNPYADPLNKHVTLAFFGLTGVCMGIAQHVCDLALESLRRRAAAVGVGALDTAATRALGQIVAEIDAMFTAITDIAKRTDEIVFTPERILTPTEEIRLAITNVMAAETLKRTIEQALEIYGSRYLFDSDPMQRVLRDAYGALAHMGSKRMHWSQLAQTVITEPSLPPTLFDEPWRSTTA